MLRSLATVVDQPANGGASSSSNSRPILPSRGTGRLSRHQNKKAAWVARHQFVVRPPASLASDPTPTSAAVPARSKAPRYSHVSSRVRGRRPRGPQKALSQTELNAETGRYEPSQVGQVKVLLPSVFVRLVRNSGREKDDPFTATFRTSTTLTKLDVTNYLKNIYGLNVTSIRTVNYANKLKRNSIGGGMSRSSGTKNYKKVVVTMEEPFWYPPERSAEWCNEHFERDRMEAMRDRKMLMIGDGNKYGKQSTRFRGAKPPRTEIERQIALETGNATSERFSSATGEAELKKPRGLKKLSNVQRSRAEQAELKRVALEREMERLREEGW